MPWRKSTRRTTWWQTGALVLALISVAAGIWWLLRPPTADALYQKITARARGGHRCDPCKRRRRPGAADSGVPQPLLRRPSRRPSSRVSKGHRVVSSATHLRSSRPRLCEQRQSAADQQEYMEAIRYLDLEPEWGATRLQAMIDLYDHDRKGDASGPTGQCLTLARRRLAKIRQEIDQYSTDQLTLLQERLAEADSLRTTNPKTAQSIYRAVAELYDRKPWARDAVGHAREALEHMEAPASILRAAAQRRSEGEGDAGSPINEESIVSCLDFDAKEATEEDHVSHHAPATPSLSSVRSRIGARDPARPGESDSAAVRPAGRANPRADRVDARPLPTVARHAGRRNQPGGGTWAGRRDPLRHSRQEGSPPAATPRATSGIIAQAIRAAKQAARELLVITDVCFCEYTDHGHCGIAWPVDRPARRGQRSPRWSCWPGRPWSTPGPAPTWSPPAA